MTSTRRDQPAALDEEKPGVDHVQGQPLGAGGFSHRAHDPQLPRQGVQSGQHPVTRTDMHRLLSGGGGVVGGLFAPAKPLDQFDQLRGQAGEIGQGLMDHDGLGWGTASGRAATGTLGGNAPALDQEDGLVVLGAVPGAIAFD
ncbi:MAG: hypothetical protein KDM81_20150, partial [Verrucomicrobiae bacterium]|nr:hypothetical protein [Verrucomicrobiae bacterium]